MDDRNMITVEIDGKPVTVEQDTTILEAARRIGVFIPALCSSDLVDPYAACRLCVVEVDDGRRKKLVTSCNYPLRRPVSVETSSEKVMRNRKTILEMMLARWPNVKLISDLAAHAGVSEPRFIHPGADLNPNACVLCGLCMRICEQGIWENIINFTGRGADRSVRMPYDSRQPHCIGCGACAEICPTGAITMADDPNQPYDAEMVRRAGMRVTEEMIKYDDEQCDMRGVGTAHLVEIMDAYDLLPVMNYRFGAHEDTPKISSDVFRQNYFSKGKPDGCWLGCTMACAKAIEGFRLKTGPYRGEKVLVDGPEYETLGGSSNMGVFDPDFVVEYNFYCDTYGLDTISFSTMTAFIMECYEAGVLDNVKTGGLEIPFGAGDAALELLHLIGRGEGFGLIAGRGIRYMKKYFAENFGADPAFLQDIGMEAKGMEYSEYVTKESLAQQGGYGIALKGAQHDEAWLIFMDMVNKQIPTFEDKAEALHYFPMWRTWFGLCGLCKLPWNDVEPPDNAETDEPAKVPGHVQGYCEFFEGVTGKPQTMDSLVRMSEKVYNFQRVFNLRMGFGRREHDVIPYRSAGPVTVEEYESRQERYDAQLKEDAGIDPKGMSSVEKVAALRKHREKQYEHLLDAVYKRRGWTSDGVPTVEKLLDLGIDFPDVLELVRKHGG
ncbi:MAG: (2Fe-2S)-binding protein [Candidatus Fermentibacteraceae bacterium]|nr:(2Fe-2S)-binding protein [Candidatus Fermentibacteraceae bacterium]MBN2609820.1 (2Fe-2S)-binding protein [Candidatus Fermentibacteraceae bacterium]